MRSPCWIDSLQKLAIKDTQIKECLSILQGISIADAEWLESIHFLPFY